MIGIVHYQYSAPSGMVYVRVLLIKEQTRISEVYFELYTGCPIITETVCRIGR